MKVLIACGGSGGHVFPGLALADELIEKNPQTEIALVVSTRERDRRYLQVAKSFLEKVKVETILPAPMPYKRSLLYLVFFAKVFVATAQSLFIVIKFRPNIVVGFGGNVSFAPILASRLLGIPSLIHEPNLIPGRANHFLSSLANKIAISFKETENYFSKEKVKKKLVHTGLPLRKMFYQDVPLKDYFDKDKYTIVVAGGSQGAHQVNKFVLESVRLMGEEEHKRLRVIHISGNDDVDYVKNEYMNLTIEHEVYGFLENMADVLRAADILICRSGANTIFEAASFGLACIVIPHPYGTEHQKINAGFLERIGAAAVIHQSPRASEELGKLLKVLIEDNKTRVDLSRRLKSLHNPDARKNIREEIMSLQVKK
jgi:UDP-N-acetylglucosamine--N-acetylmuramyl-(pentapeptide) pyrophosphoryl-undecaprenol N-acetylglucosamine transferase